MSEQDNWFPVQLDQVLEYDAINGHKEGHVSGRNLVPGKRWSCCTSRGTVREFRSAQKQNKNKNKKTKRRRKRRNDSCWSHVAHWCGFDTWWSAVHRSALFRLWRSLQRHRTQTFNLCNIKQKKQAAVSLPPPPPQTTHTPPPPPSKCKYSDHSNSKSTSPWQYQSSARPNHIPSEIMRIPTCTR